MPEPPLPRSTFHHGDLKAQALAAARERLAAQPPESLGLRELATALGVNHRALYRHFPDRAALIHLVAAAELAALVDTMDRAAEAEADPPRRREAMMAAYIAYALDQPRLYELVFALPLRDDLDAETPVGLQVRRLIRLAARLFADEGDSAAQTRDRVIRSWAAAHGLLLLARRGALKLGSRRQAERYVLAAAFGRDPETPA